MRHLSEGICPIDYLICAVDLAIDGTSSKLFQCKELRAKEFIEGQKGENTHTHTHTHTHIDVRMVNSAKH